ncbi:MAG TPA: PPC domain-containing DNA-binding protein [Stenomitos sp.]
MTDYRGMVAPGSQGVGGSPVQAFALRLRPGEDLLLGLERFATTQRLQAGFVMAIVGSLRHARIRLANQPEATDFAGTFEIVSLSGTLTEEGAHLHLSLSDGTGRTIGGHLVDGCLVYTTAEVILGELSALTFSRELDPETTYPELVVTPRSDSV